MSIENTSLQEARIYKDWLRFQIGSLVYLKSDLKKRNPMTVSLLLYDSDDVDYRCYWFNSQKVKEVGCFHDLVLTT